MNMNQKNLDALLSMASKKAGVSPDEFKKNLQNGDLSQITKVMSKDDNAKLQQALADKKILNKIMSSPEAQDIMRKLSGGK